jgi:hypothetical protein
MIRIGACMAGACVVVALIACGKKAEEARPPDPGAAPPPVAAIADAQPVAVAPAGPADAAPAPFLPATIDAKSGVVFAEQAGGAVEGIADGTIVKVIDEAGGAVGDQADATVTIEHGGKKLTVRMDRVLREGSVERLYRSPDGKHAVFAPIVACGDFCHSVLWLISTVDGRRVKLGDGGPDTHVAWHPDGSTVAVGSGSLWIVSRADHAVTAMAEHTSPSYSPDGTLYIRDRAGSAYTIASGGKPVRVWDSEKEDGDEDEMSSDDPKPVEFEDGKPNFELVYFPH